MNCPKCRGGIVSKLAAGEVSRIAALGGRLCMAAAAGLILHAFWINLRGGDGRVTGLLVVFMGLVELSAGAAFAYKAWELLGAKKVIGCRDCGTRFEQGPYGSVK
jgi:hypothetical protein